MLTIGDTLPDFELTAVKPGKYIDSPNDAFMTINNDTYKGKWLVLFFWPKDFTFVCPTEIKAFGDLEPKFSALNAQLLGVSTDSEFVHLAWKKDSKDLADLPVPMLADLAGIFSDELGIFNEEALVANRATFIVDPEGIIKFASVTDLSVGRNPDEVLRVLEASQTGELVPCNWQPGQATIS